MAIDFSKYDKEADLKGIQEDTQKAIENGGEFEEKWRFRARNSTW